MKTKNIILLVISTILTGLFIYSLFFIKPTTYKITFNTDGGNIISNIEVEKGKTISKPADPTKEGYKFLGWYIGEEEYNFDNKIDKNIELLAKWEQIKEEKNKTTKKAKK